MTRKYDILNAYDKDIQDTVTGGHQYPDLPELSPDPGQNQISFQVLVSQYHFDYNVDLILILNIVLGQD